MTGQTCLHVFGILGTYTCLVALRKAERALACVFKVLSHISAVVHSTEYIPVSITVDEANFEVSFLKKQTKTKHIFNNVKQVRSSPNLHNSSNKRKCCSRMLASNENGNIAEKALHCQHTQKGLCPGPCSAQTALNLAVKLKKCL